MSRLIVVRQHERRPAGFGEVGLHLLQRALHASQQRLRQLRARLLGGQLGLLEPANLGTALLLLPVVPVGYLLGLRILKRVSPAIFIRVASVGLLLTGTKLLWDVTRAS